MELIFAGKGDKSITTMNTLIPGKTRLHFCGECGHCQTESLQDLKSYYEDVYELGRMNEEDDQLYSSDSGRPVYRAEHQAVTLISKLALDSDLRVLDFGCGKSLTMKRVCGTIRDFQPYLYDVSGRYLSMWEGFTARERCFVNELPLDLLGTFDLVTSFYALEHIENLSFVLSRIRDLLKPGGKFYMIVPDAAQNPADFIVADHVNHFCKSSLERLLNGCDFSVLEIDDESHFGAIICLAERNDGVLSGRGKFLEFGKSIMEGRERLYLLADFWAKKDELIKRTVNYIPLGDPIAVYGAGFYGTYLMSIIESVGRRPVVILDANPYLQGSSIAGVPVVDPEAIPDNVSWLFVGLNPKSARSVIAGIQALNRSSLNLVFMD